MLPHTPQGIHALLWNLERVVNFSALFAASRLRPLILPAVISSLYGTKGLSN